MANDAKVKLVGLTTRVIFDVTPGSLSESRTANYDPWSIVHLPTDLYAYRNTSSRNWSISAILVSRTGQEAEANAKILHTIRSWLLPDFGRTGAPPEILKFSAYGDPNINEVRCILQNYSWNYPSEVDYVFMSSAQPGSPAQPLDHKMPVISTLNITLMEVWSAMQIQNPDGPWRMQNTGYNQITNPDGFGRMDPNSITPSQPLLGNNSFPVPNPSNLVNNAFSFGDDLLQDPLSGLTNSLPPLNVTPPGFSNIIRDEDW